ncbi:hypothetical protein KIW84_035604 [Lathyrus oleraceus]|uniref:Uncharacterized protein n=1 Tax=Pisum sativum TaxID=3888 RepID=A0A9D4Y232_PEA|nr:hypothetical protein KIW84_035604 [Pisum sativum]
MKEPIIPWKFLDILEANVGMEEKVQEEKRGASTKQPKSFVKRSITSWNLSPSFLKLFPWTKDFNVETIPRTSVDLYPWVLIDLNLNSDLRYKVFVERIGYAFFVDLEYENLLEFYNNCNIIGHCLDNYKRRGDDNDNGNQKKKGGRGGFAGR